MSETKVVSFRLPVDLIEELDEQAARLGLDRTKVLLDRLRPPETPAPGGRSASFRRATQ